MYRLWPRDAEQAPDSLDAYFEEFSGELAAFVGTVATLIDRPDAVRAPVPADGAVPVELYSMAVTPDAASLRVPRTSVSVTPVADATAGERLHLSLVVALHAAGTPERRWLRTVPSLLADVFLQLVQLWAAGISALGPDFALRMPAPARFRTPGATWYGPAFGAGEKMPALGALDDDVLEHALRWSAGEHARLPSAAPAAARVTLLAHAMCQEPRVCDALARLDLCCGQRPGLARTLPRLVASLALYPATHLAGPSAKEWRSVPVPASTPTTWWYVPWPDPVFARAVWWPLQVERTEGLVSACRSALDRVANKLA